MEERIEKTFETPEGCDLVVKNVRGEITVEGWDQPTTEIVAIRRKGKAEIEIFQEGRQVTARIKDERNGFGILELFTKGNTPVVDFLVRVPVTSNTKLTNVNGTIRATHISGKAKVNNVDGSAILDRITGEIHAETVNGTLETKQIAGSADLKTVNGKMKVQGDTLDHLHAHTVNGDIRVAATLDSNGDYGFHTVNGSCKLYVQPSFRAHVSAHGVNMSVKCQLPSESVSRKFGQWEGTIGSGDGPLAEVSFHTVNGKLRILTDGEEEGEPFAAKAKADEPAEPITEPVAVKVEEPVEPATEQIEVKVDEPAPEQTKSKAEILQMVERGEISVDEAIKLLPGAR
jgi:DUF4097 and DUF4098 domain-containing protein YvlB